MKLVPDESERAAERKVLEGLGFTVIEITSAPIAPMSGALLKEYREQA
jgi:hypothetical protein